jgi:hypothetical protein
MPSENQKRGSQYQALSSQTFDCTAEIESLWMRKWCGEEGSEPSCFDPFSKEKRRSKPPPSSYNSG